MARKRKIDKPFDFSFRIMDNEYPKELHNDLKVPGIFRKKLNRKVYFKDGSIAEMDASYLVDPDFIRIFETTAVNGEHQSTVVDDNKIRMIGRYGIQQMHEENVPQMVYVASHIPKEKHVQSYRRSISDIVEPLYIDLGEEDNMKRLINVENKINNQDGLSNEDALNLGIIVLFAPRHISCEVTERVVGLYVQIVQKLPRKMELTLYSVICAMIDAYFDDEEGYGRMMKMMNENTSQETVEEFVSLDIFKNDLKEANARIKELERDNARIKELENEIAKLKMQIRNSK